MKTYALKDVIIDLENPTNILVYYTGKDGYVQDDVHYCDGYIKKGMAELKLKKEVNDSWIREKVNDNCYIENKKWFHHLSIVESEVADYE